jgi:RecA-family ATPase
MTTKIKTRASSIKRVACHFKTAKQIAAAPDASIDWLVKPWIARGSITELTGRPKEAGKTTLLLNGFVQSIVTGKKFLREPVKKGRVVYLTEEMGPTFKRALTRANLAFRSDLHVLSQPKTFGSDWSDIVSAAMAKCKKVGARLLIVDTLAPFANLFADQENTSSGALEILGPLRKAAASGLAVLIVRHERKRGGGVAVAGRGSSAFAGACDILLSLKRPRHKQRPEMRILQARSRFEETPEHTVIILQHDHYQALREWRSADGRPYKRPTVHEIGSHE